LERWNVYYRGSSNRGNTWNSEVDLSMYASGFNYTIPDGFRFPFGDYYELDIDEQGMNHVVFGEALNYDSPSSIWYVKGKWPKNKDPKGFKKPLGSIGWAMGFEPTTF
jgi:hypothetical protein